MSANRKPDTSFITPKDLQNPYEREYVFLKYPASGPFINLKLDGLVSKYELTKFRFLSHFFPPKSHVKLLKDLIDKGIDLSQKGLWSAALKLLLEANILTQELKCERDNQLWLHTCLALAKNNAFENLSIFLETFLDMPDTKKLFEKKDRVLKVLLSECNKHIKNILIDEYTPAQENKFYGQIIFLALTETDKLIRDPFNFKCYFLRKGYLKKIKNLSPVFEFIDWFDADILNLETRLKNPKIVYQKNAFQNQQLLSQIQLPFNSDLKDDIARINASKEAFAKNELDKAYMHLIPILSDKNKRHLLDDLDPHVLLELGMYYSSNPKFHLANIKILSYTFNQYAETIQLNHPVMQKILSSYASITFDEKHSVNQTQDAYYEKLELVERYIGEQKHKEALHHVISAIEMYPFAFQAYVKKAFIFLNFNLFQAGDPDMDVKAKWGIWLEESMLLLLGFQFNNIPTIIAFMKQDYTEQKYLIKFCLLISFYCSVIFRLEALNRFDEMIRYIDEANQIIKENPYFDSEHPILNLLRLDIDDIEVLYEKYKHLLPNSPALSSSDSQNFEIKDITPKVKDMDLQKVSDSSSSAKINHKLTQPKSSRKRSLHSKFRTSNVNVKREKVIATFREAENRLEVKKVLNDIIFQVETENKNTGLDIKQTAQVKEVCLGTQVNAPSMNLSLPIQAQQLGSATQDPIPAQLKEMPIVAVAKAVQLPQAVTPLSHTIAFVPAQNAPILEQVKIPSPVPEKKISELIEGTISPIPIKEIQSQKELTSVQLKETFHNVFLPVIAPQLKVKVTKLTEKFGLMGKNDSKYKASLSETKNEKKQSTFQDLWENCKAWGMNTDHPIYAVGGSVQEFLLSNWNSNIVLKDRDLVTSAPYELLSKAILNEHFYLTKTEMTLPSKHSVSYIWLDSDIYATVLHNPTVRYGLHEDFQNRDTTIGSLYCLLSANDHSQKFPEIIDPTGEGLKHLEGRMNYFFDSANKTRKQKILDDPIIIIRLIYKSVKKELTMHSRDHQLIKEILNESPQLFEKIDKTKLTCWIKKIKALTKVQQTRCEFFYKDFNLHAFVAMLNDSDMRYKTPSPLQFKN